MPPSDQLPPNTPDKVVQRLDDEVKLHDSYEKKRSILSKGVDWVYNTDANTFESLKRLQAEAHKAQSEGASDRLKQLLPSINAATDADNQALSRKQTISSYSADFIKTAFLFMPGFRGAKSAAMPIIGVLGTATTYGLDQAKANDTGTHQLQDFGLGAVKGVATKTLLSETHFKANEPLLTGMMLGSGSRLVDTAFTRETWANGMDQGLKTTVAKSLTGDALKADLGIMATGVFVNAGLRKLSSVSTERSLLMNNVGAGASFGFASGINNELGRQDDSKEGRDWGKVAVAGFSHAGLDAVAAIPGGIAAERVTKRPLPSETTTKNETKNETKNQTKPETGHGASTPILEATAGRMQEGSLLIEPLPSSRALVAKEVPAVPALGVEELLKPVMPGAHAPRALAVQVSVPFEAVPKTVAGEGPTQIPEPVRELRPPVAAVPAAELGRPEVETGAASPRETKVPAEQVARIGVPPGKELPLTDALAKMNKPPTHTVSDLLRTVDPADAGIHSLADYARAMENYPKLATSIEKVGGDAVSVNLANGDVLKLTTRTLVPTDRFFDAPVVETGSMQVGDVKVNYYVQERGQSVTDAQYSAFVRDLAAKGYWFTDPGKQNTAYFPGQDRVALIDPWAVEKLPPRPGEAEPLKPLNAASMSEEEAGKLASNFAPTPFTFKGKRYASFESFYQSLKAVEPKERAAIARLPGKEAKRAGSKLHATETKFDGQTVELGSAEHHAILQEAMLEKFLQNPEAAQALVDTYPRPIVHDLGRPEDANTRLPAADFTRMLTEIRDHLRQMDLSTLGKRK